MTDDAALKTISMQMNPTRPLLWSVKREVWENRSIVIAPLAATGIMLMAFLFSTMTLSGRLKNALALDPVKQRELVQMPYNASAAFLMVTAFVIGFFYCLDALHGERRDRSILFWKSLPVSDVTTVLSKAAIPLVVLPLFVYGIVLAAHLFMLFLNVGALLGNQAGLRLLWTNLPIVRLWIAMAWALLASVLWHAPIYAWLLLVSGWAKRATFIWAVFPFLAVAAFEVLAFRTSLFGHLIRYRLSGWFANAFVITRNHLPGPADPFDAMTPGKFFSTPGLWFGLVIAVACIVFAIRLRRYRAPI